MANKKLISNEGKIGLNKMASILGLSFLAFLLVTSGILACKKAEEISPEQETVAQKENIIEFEGTVKAAYGKYVFVPETRGFDIVIQGGLETGDTGTLIDKEVRGEGEFSIERPSILTLNKLEVKEESGEWRNIFTRIEDVVLDDFIDLRERDEFQLLKNLVYDKKDTWEGKEKVRVYGKLEKQGEAYRIIVLDDKDRMAGKIIVDNITDFANYYAKKLRLFDTFWFYLNVKETVDWGIRKETKEMFHADLLFSGLF